MKKSLLALAALTAFAGAASAQSSVTLFGILDVNVRMQDNEGSNGTLTTLSNNGLATSRLGFRGVEDLGGGMRAGFWLEGELFPDTGNPGGQNWQRRSTVSLLGGFGEVRLGRDYVPTFWNHTQFDPFGTNGVGSQTNLMEQRSATVAAAGTTGGPALSPSGTRTRSNNTFGYFLPSMGGLYGQVMLSAGEGVAGNKYQGFRLGYGAGPMNVAVAYGVTDNGANPDLKAFNVGGSYALGGLTLYGQYHTYEYGSVEQKNYLLGATYAIGAGTVKFSYGAVDVNGPEATQIAVGYTYDLSKRTAVYTAYSKISQDTGLRFLVGGSGAAVSNTLTGQGSSGFEVGIRHSF